MKFLLRHLKHWASFTLLGLIEVFIGLAEFLNRKEKDSEEED